MTRRNKTNHQEKMYWRILQFYRQPKPLHNRTIGRNLHKQIENDIIFDSFIACSIDQSRYRIASKLYVQTDNGIYAVQMYQQICFCFLTIADRDLLGAGQAGTLTNVSFICLSRQCITYQYKYTQLPPLKTLLLSKTLLAICLWLTCGGHVLLLAAVPLPIFT